MVKLVIICVTSLLIFATDLPKSKLSKHHSVETYEIQSGILAMPTYSDEGELCSVVLEKRHVSPEAVDLDAEMSPEELYRIFDELVPRSERTKSKSNPEDNGENTIFDGGTLTTTADYGNVSLKMYGKYKKVGTRGYVAAMIQWNDRNCSHGYPAGSGGSR